MSKMIPDTTGEKILVAKVVAPHGVNGALSAESFSDNPRRFAAGSVLLAADGRQFTVTAASPHKGRLLLTLAGVTDRTAAEGLRGLELYASLDQVESLPEGSFYHFQLLGLRVWDGERDLGELTDILNYAANDVYLIRDEAGRELLLPALKSVVLAVDLAQRVMRVRLPEGLS